MGTRQVIAWTTVSVGLLVFVFELVRRRRLREGFSALWFLTCLGILVLVLFPDLLAWAARLLGVERPSYVLFVFGMVFLVVVEVHHSVVLSSLLEQTKSLAQSVALLEAEQRERLAEQDSTKAASSEQKE
jgi:hypothetical protein